MNKIMKAIAMFMVWLTVTCVCAYILLTMAGFLWFGFEMAELIDLMEDVP